MRKNTMEKALQAHDIASHTRGLKNFREANKERTEAVTELASELNVDYTEAFNNMVEEAETTECTVCGKTHD